MPRRLKTFGPKVRSAPGRQPFVDAIEELLNGAGKSWRTWPQAEQLFLDTLADFDRLVANGKTTQGDRQNGKGDFFNDLLAILLARCSGKSLHRRPKIPGLIFANHALDIAYPATGTVLLTVETKATGIPKHPGSQSQDATGRPGHADLEKRIKEAAFKDIDIKAQHAASLGTGGGPTVGSNLLRSWLQRTPPQNWLLLSARVRDQNDLTRVIDFATAASRWFEHCGLYAYGHRNWRLNQRYEAKAVPAALRMQSVLPDICTELRNLP
jgi:hypothetical protein